MGGRRLKQVSFRVTTWKWEAFKEKVLSQGQKVSPVLRTFVRECNEGKIELPDFDAERMFTGFELDPDEWEVFKEIAMRCNKSGSRLLVDFIDSYIEGEELIEPQNHQEQVESLAYEKRIAMVGNDLEKFKTIVQQEIASLKEENEKLWRIVQLLEVIAKK